MSENPTIKPLAIAASAVFITSLAGTSAVSAAGNPFAMTELSSGYMVAEMAEGKCGGMKKEGEGKSGDMKMEGEGKCGGMKPAAEEKASKEGKCGEGKCGGDKMGGMHKDGAGMETEKTTEGKETDQ